MMESETINPYFEGYKEALYDYAWWKDGVMYVGCGVYTYKEALKDAEERQ